MNIAMILSGGIGSRFGSIVPKQYNLISGMPVIDYVIDALQKTSGIDRIVVVMDAQWLDYSEKIKNSEFEIVQNGETRYKSMWNGLELINKKYACEKIIILDAVAPFVYAELIDKYIQELDSYDAVITAQKITGGFTDINDSLLDRENYIITQSPEAFRFPLLYQSFRIDFPYQETAGMLPKGSKRKYYFDFKDNLKITYDFDLEYAELRLRSRKLFNNEKTMAFFDKNIFFTDGIKKFLLRVEPDNTRNWINHVYEIFPKLIQKWSIISFIPNQISRYGLVLLAKSREHGEVVIKLIPPFVNRFEREKEAMQLLSDSYMCPLLGIDEDENAMMIRRISPAKYATFDDNKKLTIFFKNAVNNAIPYVDTSEVNHIRLHFEELKEKKESILSVPFLREEISYELEYAIDLYEKNFSNEKLYILHGDLIDLNVLDDGERLWGIDPNGFIAPIEFECVRFIRNDVRNHADFGYPERFDLLVHSFSRFVDARRLVCMFIIDMAMCTYNSTFENEDDLETRVDLELISIAKEWLKIHQHANA